MPVNKSIYYYNDPINPPNPRIHCIKHKNEKTDVVITLNKCGGREGGG